MNFNIVVSIVFSVLLLIFVSIFLMATANRMSILATSDLIVKDENDVEYTLKKGTLIPADKCVIEKSLLVFVELDNGVIGYIDKGTYDRKYSPVFDFGSAVPINFTCPIPTRRP